MTTSRTPGTSRITEWIQQNRILFALCCAAFLSLAIGWTFYILLGHRLIEAMYKGQSFEFLNRFVDRQDIYSLEHYLGDADELMWSATLITLIFWFALMLIAKNPSRITVTILTPMFVGVTLLASGIAFFYPLEIETRESTVWLHVLTLMKGVNIYDHSQVAFINMYAGPIDSLFKLLIASLLPFLESWQVTRFAVFLLPYAFFIVASKIIAKSHAGSLLDIFYLGSIGYLFLLLSAKEFLFVGRMDATAALFLVLLAYASISFSPKMQRTSALHGFACGTIGVSVVLTSWRTAPAVFGVLMFAIWLYRNGHQAPRRIILTHLASYLVASLGIWGFLLFYFFDFNLLLYYKHFFGLFSEASGWGNRPYNGSVISFIISLFNPAAVPWRLKGGPLLLALAVYLLTRGQSDAVSRGWRLLSWFVLAFCAVSHYLNYGGGGSWYFIPFVLILWFYLSARYATLNQPKLAWLGICILVLIGVNVRTVVLPTLKRAIGMQEAYEFMTHVRSLQSTNTIVSEDTFLFKASYEGELIDMGDIVPIVSKTGYYGNEFSRTVKRHFDRLQNHPPDYIVTGLTGSHELRTLIREKYLLAAEGPDNLTANWHHASKLFKRKDLTSPSRPIVELDRGSQPQ